MIKQFRYIFNRKQKAGLLLLLIAIIVGTFLELAGVAANSYGSTMQLTE